MCGALWCGEICPKVCRVCNKKNFDEYVPVIFGTEEADDEETRFIQLADCEHIFEVKSLDNWLEGRQNELSIQWPACPICKTPVFQTLRYVNIAKKTRQDMNTVKEKELYTLEGEERKVLKQELERLASNSPLINSRESHLYKNTLEYLNDYRLYNEYLVLHIILTSRSSDVQLKLSI